MTLMPDHVPAAASPVAERILLRHNGRDGAAGYPIEGIWPCQCRARFLDQLGFPSVVKQKWGTKMGYVPFPA
jgi:hypothetical protein